LDNASYAIFALKPVTFRYKEEFHPDSIPQFGLVAAQVEKVNPDLVARDEEGRPYTVRYDAVNAMLLNEFIKEHHTVQEQQAAIAEMKAALTHQQEQIARTCQQGRAELGHRLINSARTYLLPEA
jgi:trimeric autotransporter adhesin